MLFKYPCHFATPCYLDTCGANPSEPMKHKLLIPITVVLCAAVAFIWWQRLPPSSTQSWSNRLGNVGMSSQFWFGAYAANDQEPSIAYFVRINDQTPFAIPPPWLKTSNRRVFVQGRHIPYRAGALRLFIADGGEEPRQVILDVEDAQRYFGRRNREIQTFEACVHFWNDVLRKKYLPELIEQ